MAKLPPIDLSELLKLLKADGRSELASACMTKLGAHTTIMREWDNIINGLELLVPKLAKGTEMAEIKGPIMLIWKSAGNLSALASQFLSFVPGPIGMVCSFINAIVCFCTMPFPVNIGNGFLELLGCIPGGKVAVKGGAKLAPQIEKIIVKILQDNKFLMETIEKSKEIQAAVKNFAKKATKNTSKITTHNTHAGTTPSVKHKTDRHRLDIDESTYYGNSSSPSSVLFEGDQVVRRYQIMPRPITNVGNPLANPWSHLF